MLVSFLCVVLILCGAFASLVPALVSYYNYPGGYALKRFNDLVIEDSCESNTCRMTTVHMDVLACMTGVSRYYL